MSDGPSEWAKMLQPHFRDLRKKRKRLHICPRCYLNYYAEGVVSDCPVCPVVDAARAAGFREGVERAAEVAGDVLGEWEAARAPSNDPEMWSWVHVNTQPIRLLRDLVERIRARGEEESDGG